MDESRFCRGPIKVLEHMIETNDKNLSSAYQAFSRELAPGPDRREFARQLENCNLARRVNNPDTKILMFDSLDDTEFRRDV